LLGFRFIVLVLRLEAIIALVFFYLKPHSFFVRVLPGPRNYSPSSFRIVFRNGVRLRLDMSQYIDWNSFYHLDPEHKSLVYELIKPGMFVIDVGSNNGEMALNFARLTGKSGSVIGFEPVPANFKRCKYNFDLNGFANLKVESSALGDLCGNLFFDDMPLHNSGGAFLSIDSNEQTMAIPVTTLDQYALLNNLTRMDFVKIDVEGSELNVLKGAISAINTFKPMMCIEVNDEHLRRQGGSEEELLGFLNALNYTAKALTPVLISKNGVRHYDLLAEPKIG
jgi:FkbM family methyltransferase